MTNLDLAELFSELADIMELAGENHFKIRAYRNASRAILEMPHVVVDTPPEMLVEIPGIGKAIAEKIQTAKMIGTFPTLEKWRQSGFSSFRPLLKLPGISMSKLRALLKDLELSSINDLTRAAADGRLRAYKKIDSQTKDVLFNHLIQDK